jgi:hypothetical protein
VGIDRRGLGCCGRNIHVLAHLRVRRPRDRSVRWIGRWPRVLVSCGGSLGRQMHRLTNSVSPTALSASTTLAIDLIVGGHSRTLWRCVARYPGPRVDRFGTDRADLNVSLSIRRSLLIAVVVAGVFASLVSRQRSDAAPAVVQRLEPVQFVPTVGWHVRRGSVYACPGVSASRCSSVTSTASTTRWRDCLHCLPHRTVAAMSPEDIAMQVTLGIERPLRIQRTFAWPPRVSRRNVHAGFEGLPGRIGVYQGSTRVGAREVFVFIFLGRARPTDRQLNRTNAELRGARLG